MKKFGILLGLIFVAAVGAFAQVQVGGKVSDFTLPDTDGKMHTVADLKGSNGLVLIFVSAQCPVVRGYNERMNELYKAYKAKGINVVGVDSNVTEPADEVKAHAAMTWDFPVLIDKDAKVADMFGANVTPEAYFIDAGSTLIYHGAIDDDRSGRAVTKRWLQTAFDANLAGKKIEKTSANAFGCSIKRSAQ